MRKSADHVVPPGVANSLSNGISMIIVTTIIKVLIFGLKVFASSHNPVVKKII